MCVLLELLPRGDLTIWCQEGFPGEATFELKGELVCLFMQKPCDRENRGHFKKPWKGNVQVYKFKGKRAECKAKYDLPY